MAVGPRRHPDGRVADQRTIAVPRPEFVSIGPKNQALLVWDEDEGARILNMLMITGIDVPKAGP